MKRNSKVTRTLSCEYLLTDGSGSLIQLFEEFRDGVRIGETADITLGYCKVTVHESYSDVYSFRQDRPHGRIVLHRGEYGFSKLAKGGKVSGTVPNIEGGSESSKRLGHAVQYVWLETKNGDKLDWCDVPSVVGSRFTVQMGDQYKLPETVQVGYRLWSDIPIMKVTDLRPKETEQADVA
jgi:hypothetical protein